MEIAIAFIENTSEGENFVLTTYCNLYPSYKAGDILFLQITNREDETKSKKTTKYMIVDVHHSIRENTSRNSKSEKNPLGITVFMGLEVYVKEVIDWK